MVVGVVVDVGVVEGITDGTLGSKVGAAACPQADRRIVPIRNPIVEDLMLFFIFPLLDSAIDQKQPNAGITFLGKRRWTPE